MGRKVFISVLGTGFYGACKYVKDGFVSTETRFIQQATLEYVKAHEWGATDTGIFLLTQRAKETNWDKTIASRQNMRLNISESYEGLESILEKMELPFKCQSVDILDGKDEDEMWGIFNEIFNQIEEGDELYFDLTHSFRYLPMLVLVLNNYAKFLKNVTTKHISYGNYEARNTSKNEAPIVDLLPLSSLQDWTFAAANYLRNGDVSELNTLCVNSLTPILSDSQKRVQTPSAGTLKSYVQALKELIEDMKWCRGVSILNGDHIRKVIDLSNMIDEVIITPMRPVLAKMKESFSKFTPTADVLNGYRAAKWCYENQLYQQSLTILHENMVSHICLAAGIDYKNDKKRGPVNSAFKIAFDNIPEDKWIVSCEEEKKVIKELLSMDEVKNLLSSFGTTTGLRNDYNHAGMRSNPTKANVLKERLKEIIDCIYGLYMPEE